MSQVLQEQKLPGQGLGLSLKKDVFTDHASLVATPPVEDNKQNDLIIDGSDVNRQKYLNALYEKGEEETKIDWLMWY